MWIHPAADPNPSFQIKALKLLKKVLKEAPNIPYILACHLQMDADPDPGSQNDADPDPQHW